MEHSAKFEKVRSYFRSGLWSEMRVRNAVDKGWIREDEFEEIVHPEAEV